MMQEIDSIEDEIAVRAITNIAVSALRQGERVEPMSPALKVALAQYFEISPTDEVCSEGDLARGALVVLASDPEFTEPIEILETSGHGSKTYGAIEVVSLITAAMFVLQSYIEIQYKDGKWLLHFKKRPAKDDLLKDLVQKLMAFYSGSPDKQLPPE